MYSGTSLIQSPMGQEKLTVLTTVFYKKMYVVFARLPKKVAIIRWL